jgi:hypothetical protein
MDVSLAKVFNTAKRWIVVHTIQEERAGFIVGSDALEQCESITDTIRSGGSQLRWVQQRIDRDNFLQQGCHDTCGPQWLPVSDRDGEEICAWG